MRIDENTFEKGLEFQNHNKNIVAFSVKNPIILPSDFPLNFCFIDSDSPINSINYTSPFGINFSSESELEPGVVDFEKLENDLLEWVKHI